MPKNAPPPFDSASPIGAPSLPHATSICEPGHLDAVQPDVESAGRKPTPLVPAPPSVLEDASEMPQAPKAPVPVPRKGPIAFLPKRTRTFASPSPTIVPDEPSVNAPKVTKALAPKIVISQFRAMKPSEKSWVLPARVGSMVPALNVPGIGWIRYAGTIAVMMDSTEVDLRSGETTVYVSVCYGPADPGARVLRRKFLSKGRERFRQLEEAIAVAFTEVVPVCGLVLRLTGGPPTMTDAEMAVAGYTARAGKNRAPVRAEFVFSAIEEREKELKQLYEDVEEHFLLWRYLFLFWWWCASHARLAAYHAGERLTESEAGKDSSMTIVRRSLANRERHAAIERDVAVFARWPVASFTSLLWENEVCRAALVDKGVKVQEIAGTCLGTYLDEEE